MCIILVIVDLVEIKSKKGFKQMFDIYYNPLCNFAYSILRNSAKAEDIVQDVLMKIWEKRNDIEFNSNVKTYLFTSVRNKSFEYIRSEKSEKAKISDYTLLQSRLGDDKIDKEATIMMMKEELNNSIRHLPPKCRDIFVLSKLQGLTYNEIAELKNISVKTVETQMSIALRNLREKFKAKLDNEY